MSHASLPGDSILFHNSIARQLEGPNSRILFYVSSFSYTIILEFGTFGHCCTVLLLVQLDG